MLRLLSFDRFTLGLLLAVLVASFFPVAGQSAEYLTLLTNIVIAGLFFLHGAKLSRQAVRDGLFNWQLHGLVFIFTFVLFPLLGFLLQPVLLPLLGKELYLGVLFLCFLPSTVQSSIGFTSIAHGDVAAAICSASFSNLVGMFVTPLLVSMLIVGQSQQHQFDGTQAILKIIALLLLPFVLGQVLHSRISPYLKRHPQVIRNFDQGSIILVVYAAFSGAVVSGLWQQVSWSKLGILVLVCSILLTVVMLLALYLPRILGFNLAEQKTIFFCASKKTLASGVPMAQILFIGQPIGLILLPIMIFHQIQLMVCGVIAGYWSKQPTD